MNAKHLNKSQPKYTPEYKSIFKVKDHPFDWLTNHIELMQWCYEGSQLSQEQFDEMRDKTVAYLYPFCLGIERYVILYGLDRFMNIWNIHGLCSHEFRTEFMTVLDTLNGLASLSIAKSYAMATQTVFEHICDTYNGEQKSRFIGLWEQYYRGQLTERLAVEKGYRYSSVEEVLVLKRQSLPAIAYLQCIEFSDNICLSDEEWNDPMMCALLTGAVDCMIYAHDLWSFDAEYSEKGYNESELTKMCNVVAVNAGANNLSIERAMGAITGLLRAAEMKAMKAFMTIDNDLPNVSEGVKRFANSVNHAIGGYSHMLSLTREKFVKRNTP